MFARLSLDLVAGRLNAERQPVDGQSQQAKVIAVDSMEVGGQGPPYPDLRKSLIACLKLFPAAPRATPSVNPVWSAGMS